jgi:hypothetical protein
MERLHVNTFTNAKQKQNISQQILQFLIFILLGLVIANRFLVNLRHRKPGSVFFCRDNFEPDIDDEDLLMNEIIK